MLLLVQRKKREAENTAADRAIISFTQQIQKLFIKIQKINMKRQRNIYRNVTTQRIFRNIIFKDIMRCEKTKKMDGM